MNKAETSKALKDAEEKLKTYHGGKGVMDKPAVPKRTPPVTHGPAGTGPTPRKPR